MKDLCQSKQTLQGLLLMAFFPQTFLLVLQCPVTKLVNHYQKNLMYCRLTVNFCKEVLSLFKNYSFLFSECNLCLSESSPSLLYQEIVNNRKHCKALSHGRRMQFTEPTLLQLIYSGDGRVKQM